MTKPVHTVQLFHTCLVNELFPEVGMSVVKVLEHLGVVVKVPTAQTCCGQPALNAGYPDEAKKVARQTIILLSQSSEPIIIPSGSCASMIVNQYAELFKDDAELLPVIEKLTARCYEFSQFLVDVLGITDLNAELKQKIVYHPSCHMLRGLSLDKEPRQLLASIKGLEVTNIPDSEECCGFGGAFAVKHDEISEKMMTNKLTQLTATDASAVVSCDMGCLLHLGGGLQRTNSNMQVQHLAQIIETALL